MQVDINPNQVIFLFCEDTITSRRFANRSKACFHRKEQNTLTQIDKNKCPLAKRGLGGSNG